MRRRPPPSLPTHIAGVGKSCLLLRYCDNLFTSSFITTIGIDFKIKTVDVDGLRVKLQIWDTAGQERFKTITTAYYRGAMGIFLVYDVGTLSSYKNVHSWMMQIEENAAEDVTRVILANKSDVEDRVSCGVWRRCSGGGGGCARACVCEGGRMNDSVSLCARRRP